MLEEGPYLRRQGHHSEWLDEELFAGGNLDTVVVDRTRGERRHKQHLDAGPQTSKLCREIRSAHERHHDIREKKVDGDGSIFRQPKCFPRITRPQHRIPFGIEHVSDESQHFQLVIHDEDGSGGGACERGTLESFQSNESNLRVDIPLGFDGALLSFGWPRPDKPLASVSGFAVDDSARANEVAAFFPSPSGGELAERGA